MDEGLDAHVIEEGAVEGDEAIVDVAVIGEVDLCVVGEGIVELMPAQSWRELGSNTLLVPVESM